MAQKSILEGILLSLTSSNPLYSIFFVVFWSKAVGDKATRELRKVPEGPLHPLHILDLCACLGGANSFGV